MRRPLVRRTERARAAHAAHAAARSPRPPAAGAADAPSRVPAFRPVPTVRGEDRNVLGDSLVVGKDEVVHTVTVTGGSAKIFGTVTGDLVVAGGSAKIEDGGRVVGNATVFGGSLKVESGGRVDGDVGIVGGALKREEGAIIGGKVVDNDTSGHHGKVKVSVDDGNVSTGVESERKHTSGRTRLSEAAHSFGQSMTNMSLLFVFGCVLLALGTRRMETLRVETAARPMKSFAMGIVGSLVAIVGLAAMCITVVGIPFAALALFVAVFSVYASIAAVLTTFGATVFGHKIEEPVRSPARRLRCLPPRRRDPVHRRLRDLRGRHDRDWLARLDAARRRRRPPPAEARRWCEFRVGWRDHVRVRRARSQDRRRHVRSRSEEAPPAAARRAVRPPRTDKSFPVIVLVNGVDGAGKGETVNLLNEWMDPRHVRSRAFGPRTAEERARPPMWRFWRALPPKGKIGVLFGNWYTDPINGRVERTLRGSELPAAVEQVRRFERLLTDDGALIVKLWFHLSKKGMKKRLEELEANKLTRWRVTKADWDNFGRYDAYAKVSERVLRETSTGDAPWVVIDGSNPNYRAITAAKTLLGAIQGRLAEAKAESPHAKRAAKRKRTGTGDTSTEAAPVFETVDTAAILRDLPFKERLSKEKYETKIVKVQGTLAKLTRCAKMKDHSVVVVFEGMDAAGKGGAIRRVTQALDARHYDVIPIAAPTDEERAQPYLWRFWRHLPRRAA